MNVLLIGSGGRECALAWKIAQSASLGTLYVTAVNPGWPASALLRTGSDLVEIAKACDAHLVVVGPEAPLAAGLADRLHAEGIPCFGPQQAAARLETSKAFTKKILLSLGVPTAPALITRDRAEARERARRGQVAIKVDGLAAGKGVFVCHTAVEGEAALDEIETGRFGDAAETLVLEDLIAGPEVSLFALTDGERVVPLVSAQDHKRIGDGDTGPNTGGMGAYAPCPLLPDADLPDFVERYCTPVIRALAQRGTPYRGVLFAGLMVTREGPVVLEYNCRFGDPECQALMMLWEGDILPWLHGAAVGRLPEGSPSFATDAACCVVLASGGYPRTSTRGVAIPESPTPEGVKVFHAGTRREAGQLQTAGGRVLGITARAPTLAGARSAAYQTVEDWRFEGCQVRSDIGSKGLGIIAAAETSE